MSKLIEVVEAMQGHDQEQTFKKECKCIYGVSADNERATACIEAENNFSAYWFAIADNDFKEAMKYGFVPMGA